MITDFYTALLDELKNYLKMKELQPDSNHSCLIKFATGLEIQIEPDKTEQFLIIGTKLGSLSPGRYQTSIFKEALKANGMDYPLYGTFAFSKKSDQLILFDMLSLRELNGLKLFEYLKLFAEKAIHWKESLERGEIPSLHLSYGTKSGLFKE